MTDFEFAKDREGDRSSMLSSLRTSFARTRDALRRRLLMRENLAGFSASQPRGSGTPVVDRFSQVLSVQYYAPDVGVFFMNDGADSPVCALGRVYELTPALAADDTLAEGLERILSAELPGKPVFSVSLFASSAAVRETLREYVESRSGENRLEADAAEVLKEMAVSRARMFDSMARRLSQSSHTSVRHFRVWLSIACTAGQAELLNILEGKASRTMADFLRATQGIEATLRQFGLFAYAWDAQDWIDTVRELVNPQKAMLGLLPERSLAGHRNTPSSRDEVLPQSLRTAAVHPDTLIELAKDSIAFASPSGLPSKGSTSDGTGAGHLHCVEAVGLAVTGLPAKTHLVRMRSILGSDVSRARIRTPFVWTVNIEPTSIESDRAVSAMKHARVRQLMSTEVGQFLTDLGERGRDLELAMQACETGRGLCRMAASLVVYAASGKGVAAAHNAANVLAAAGFQAHIDVGLQVMDLMANLPLEAASSLMRDIRTAGRSYTVTRQAASHMLPVLGDFRGSPARAGESRRKPMLMLATRAGELLPLDIFANRNGNYNAVVAGTSGSGKSVLTEELVTSVLATGGRVWVFDIGKSYETVVDLAKGQFIDFDRAGTKNVPSEDTQEPTRLCLNPLDMMAEDPSESLDEVAQIIAAMANGTAPMEMTAMELIKGAIDAVVRKARSEGRTPEITDLVMHLMNTRDAALHDVAVRLSPFAAGGRFASFFEGKASVNFNSALVVLEMEALTNKPVLQSAVLLILIMRILQEIRERPRSEKKLIVIDEAWRLLTGEAAGFIEWACRTLRKYGAGIVCISQSMEDFRMSGTARAVRANADSVFLFRQKPEGIAAYTSDPALVRTLSGLTTVAESYSEVWAKVGDSAGVVGRLILDDFSMTAFSTRADVFDAVRREKAAGKTAVEAIASVAQTLRSGR